MSDASFRLVVQQVHRLSSRPWAFLTGRVEGPTPIHLGDRVTVIAPGHDAVVTAVRSIEIHPASGSTTIAVDPDDAQRWGPGCVVSPAPEPRGDPSIGEGGG